MPSCLSGRYAAVKVRKKLYVTFRRGAIAQQGSGHFLRHCPTSPAGGGRARCLGPHGAASTCSERLAGITELLPMSGIRRVYGRVPIRGTSSMTKSPDGCRSFGSLLRAAAVWEPNIGESKQQAGSDPPRPMCRLHGERCRRASLLDGDNVSRGWAAHRLLWRLGGDAAARTRLYGAPCRLPIRQGAPCGAR